MQVLCFQNFLSFTDNTVSVLAKHDNFRRQKQEMYFLPIVVTDNGSPPMSSTNTLIIRVCGCSKEGIVQSCNVEAYVLPIGLSMGALIAILACIILLLGMSLHSLFIYFMSYFIDEQLGADIMLIHTTLFPLLTSMLNLKYTSTYLF